MTPTCRRVGPSSVVFESIAGERAKRIGATEKEGSYRDCSLQEPRELWRPSPYLIVVVTDSILFSDARRLNVVKKFDNKRMFDSGIGT
jgi:hypothetical protein